MDLVIRETLAEKQKIVCDMFKIPNEHFTAIVDVASQPEAPNEPTEIVLAAFAQIQSLTETLNEYIKVSTIQEISAVSTSLCENCYKNSQPITKTATFPPQLSQIALKSLSNTSSFDTTPTGTTVRNSINLDNNDHTTDDDGYCDIDEIRFVSMMAASSNTENIIIEADTKRNGRTSVDTKKSEPILLESNSINLSNNDNADDNIESKNELINEENIECLDAENVNILNELATDDDVHEIIDQNDIRDESHQSQPIKLSDEICGTNRLIHASSITPAVPCQLLLDHVTTLGLQISQLLVCFVLI